MVAANFVQKKGRISGDFPNEDARVIDQFMDDVVNFISKLVVDSGGGDGDGVSTDMLCIERNVNQSFTIFNEVSCLQRNPILGTGVVITINSGGELYLL